MGKQTEPTIGKTYCVRYPFVRDVYLEIDEEGATKVPCWRPGAAQRHVEGDTWHADRGWYADGEGQQLLTVVSLHQPGHYPARVFYTRQWQDPDGKRFGKASLRCCTLRAFWGLAHGYRYRVEDKP